MPDWISGKMTLPTIPYTLLQAIARNEGFYVQGTRPNRNNNPGDLELRPWMTTFGATAGDPRFAIFPSEDLGFQALRHLLQFKIYKGKTISQAISQFAPGNENNVASYVRNICSWTEQQPDTVIDQILG
jgi:hypothetical protein